MVGEKVNYLFCSLKIFFISKAYTAIIQVKQEMKTLVESKICLIHESIILVWCVAGVAQGRFLNKHASHAKVEYAICA